MVAAPGGGPHFGDINPYTSRPYSERFFQILSKRQQLPCWEAQTKIVQTIGANQSSILVGETGSGKTTQCPQFLLSAGYSSIAVTQPRRVAAISIATRVAQELDVEVGAEVGYSIRFEDVTSDKTILKYMTDGTLLRECMQDPLMSRYSVVILDEAHERTLANDILFGIVKEALKKRPEFRCLVMSATLDVHKFQQYWTGAPLIEVPGRIFSVETFFSLKPEKDYAEAALDVCMLIHRHEGPGDILVFLTGEEEIEQVCAELIARSEDQDSLNVFPLYSGLTLQQQRAVFPPAPKGVRKVIVATNIAETSLTIDGIVFVVDPGLFKQSVYNPRTHAESLLVSPISKSSARQRAGRAGRTQPGKCFRLYTPDTFETEMPESTYPEIVRSNLCQVVLTLKVLGIDDLVHYDFMEPPSPEAMMRALEILYFLGALDEEGDLTKVGKQMADFPIDPHLSRTVIAAANRGCCRETVQIVAMLSVPPPFRRPVREQKWADKAHQAFASSMGDHLTMLRAYSEYSNAPSKADFCYESYLHDRAMKQAEGICRQLEGTVRKVRIHNCSVGEDADNLTTRIRKSFLEAFFMQSAHIDISGKHYITVRDQQSCDIHPSSFLQHKPEWVLYHESSVTDRCYLRNVTAITPEMLIEVSPRFYHPSTCNLADNAKHSLQRALERSLRRK